MYIVKPKAEILSMRPRDEILKNLERVGRTAYKSEDKITEESAPAFVKMLVKRNHLAVIEHESITVKFTTNRGVSHEIVRHRLASFCQESTRYCNYGKSGEVTFCRPWWMRNTIPKDGRYHLVDGIQPVDPQRFFLVIDDTNIPLSMSEEIQVTAWADTEKAYQDMLCCGCTPQQARGVLPNDVKTEIVMTANLREWIHFLNLRSKGTTGAPHPDMKELADLLYEQLVKILPEIFGE